MTRETLRYNDVIITIKESGGKYEYPFTWYMEDIDKTMLRQGDRAFLTKEACIQDAKDYFDKYLNH